MEIFLLLIVLILMVAQTISMSAKLKKLTEQLTRHENDVTQRFRQLRQESGERNNRQRPEVPPETAEKPEADVQKPAPAPTVKPEAVKTEAQAAKPEAKPAPAAPTVKPEVVKATAPEKVPLSPMEQKTLDIGEKIINWIMTGNENGITGTDREYAIATTWLTRLGVLVLLCGIGFFVKYSIDHNWVNPALRIMSSIGLGLAMTALGFFGVGKRYHLVSIGIMGAGFVTLYLSIFSGLRLYHLFSTGVAFVGLKLAIGKA